MVVVRAGAVGALADVGALTVGSLAVGRCRRAFHRVLTLLLLLLGVCCAGVGDRISGRHRSVLGLLACRLAAAPLRARVALRARAQALELVDGLGDEGVRERHLWRHPRINLPLDAFLLSHTNNNTSKTKARSVPFKSDSGEY